MALIVATMQRRVGAGRPWLQDFSVSVLMTDQTLISPAS